MENEFILAATGIQPPAITEMQSWQSPHPDPLLHTNGWDASAFNPMVSPTAGSNPTYASDENVLIRKLIGELGGFGGNPAEILGSSCYSTPLSSPQKLDDSVAAGVNPNFAEFAADPGFVERAARFSCFGSRSFNGRTGAYIGGGVEFHLGHFPAAAAAGEVKLDRVSSSPSLNGLGLGSLPRIEIGGPLRSVDRIHSMESPEEESSVIEPVLSGETGPRGSGEINLRKRKGVSNRGKTKASANAAKVIQCVVNSSEHSSAKRYRSNDGDDQNKKEGNGEGEAEEKQNKIEAEPPKDYIHVRARRGQATDSHSLAERVRREKISERMKLLQDLVPGCNKVTGKAPMLDEIINYVQSLQRQVEFLSMKLASVNTSLDVRSDSLLSKDHHHHMFPSNNTLPHHMFPGDAPSMAADAPSMAAAADLHGHPPNHRPLDSHFTPLSNLQYQDFARGGDDLHSIVQMGLEGQNSHQDTTTSLQHQRFHY